MIHLGNDEQLKIGVKQTSKAIIENKAKLVYVARDAEQHVTRRVLELSKNHRVEVEYIDSMKELGRMCNIDVGAATAVIINKNKKEREVK